MGRLAQPALAFAAGELGLERVEVRGPEASEAVEPGVGVAETGGVDRVEATCAVGPGGGKSGCAQYAQVGGDARLRDAELALNDGTDGPGCQLAVGEELEHAATDGIAEDVE